MILKVLYSFLLQEVEREKSFQKLAEELEQLAATKEMLLKVLNQRNLFEFFECQRWRKHSQGKEEELI